MLLPGAARADQRVRLPRGDLKVTPCSTRDPPAAARRRRGATAMAFSRSVSWVGLPGRGTHVVEADRRIRRSTATAGVDRRVAVASRSGMRMISWMRPSAPSAWLTELIGTERLAERHDHQEQEQDERDELRDLDRTARDPVAADAEHDEERDLHRDAGDRHDEGRDLRDPDARRARRPRLPARWPPSRARSRSRRARCGSR